MKELEGKECQVNGCDGKLSFVARYTYDDKSIIEEYKCDKCEFKALSCDGIKV